MGWLSAIIAGAKALPIIKDLIEMITGAFSAIAKKWRRYRFEKDRKDIDEAMDKAVEEKNTDDLREELGDKL